MLEIGNINHKGDHFISSSILIQSFQPLPAVGHAASLASIWCMIIIGNWNLQLTVSKENCLERSCSKPSFYFGYFRFHFNISQFVTVCLVCSDINFAIESLFMARVKEK